MSCRPISARAGVDDDASRLLGRARAELEFLRVEEVIDELPSLLGSCSRTAQKVHAAIGERYFQETRVVEWSV